MLTGWTTTTGCSRRWPTRLVDGCSIASSSTRACLSPSSKLHFLNPVPIRLVHDRWIDKYTEHHVVALTDLKHQLETTA